MEYSQNSSDPDRQSVVPKVHLQATHERALDAVRMDDLKKYSVNEVVRS